ncbi:MAG TPA: hypothetical protein VD968_07275 [Pyrinomonadaceae bacterium]|nr:hypothetical protein [Pyrinomonadaceae bacterium]
MSPTPTSPEADYRPRRRLEVGDAVLALYIAAFARQFFWPVGDNRAAWALTVALTAFVWLMHWRTKEAAGRTPALFWPVVALPLLFFYSLRAALPDLSWDVLDYRIINAERSFRGWPIPAADFFPTRFPFNPAPDMVMGLARRLLGYRLGTLVNLGAMVWAGAVLERLLRGFIRGAPARCLAVLLLLLTEQLLFEISNYMVDLLALPLMLEAARLALTSHEGAREQRRTLARVGLYLGASLAFKLTNLAVAVPVLALCAYRFAARQWRFDARAAAYALAGVALPLLPYSLYIYHQTGNPVFPLYNWLFKSPYWPVLDPRTERWGPIVDDPRFKSMRAWEVLLWPLLHPFRVEHTAGDLGPHWGRVSVGFLASIAGIAWRGADARVRALSFVTLVCAVLWSAASGMLRYAMFVELVGGLIALYFAAHLFKTGAARLPARAGACVIVAALVAQTASSCVYAFDFEWGGRPTFFRNPGAHLPELRHLFRDRDPRAFLSDEERALFDGVGAWAESSPVTSGFQVMLKPEAPEWCLYMTEFFETEVSRRRFRRAIEASRGAPVFTLCMTEEFKFATDNIRRAGFGVGRIQTLSLPYYSHRARFPTSYFIEVLPPGAGGARTFDITRAEAPLPPNGFNAALTWAASPPRVLKAGELTSVRVVLRNASASRWPALGGAGGNFRILLGNHWLDRSGRELIHDDGRGAIPYDLAPGEEAELLMTINAPPAPGDYTLEIDLLQEGVSWFALKGSKTLKADLRVEK